MATYVYLWLVIAVHGCLRLLLAVFACFWLLVPVYVCSWLRAPAYGTMPPGNLKHALERFATYAFTFLQSCVLTLISSLPIGVSAGII